MCPIAKKVSTFPLTPLLFRHPCPNASACETSGAPRSFVISAIAFFGCSIRRRLVSFRRRSSLRLRRLALRLFLSRHCSPRSATHTQSHFLGFLARIRNPGPQIVTTFRPRRRNSGSLGGCRSVSRSLYYW